MATATLIPTANQSFSSGTIAYTGGSANYTNLFDASDATYVVFTGSNAFASYPLTDTASNMSTVTGVTITIREKNGGSKGDFAKLDYVQILKSDGSTAITSTGTATDSTTATTYNIVPSSIFFTDKTSWDGAVLKIKQNVGTGTGITIYEASVAITYTTSGGTTYNNTASGGVVGGSSGTVKITSSRTASGGVVGGSSGTVKITSSKTASGGVVSSGTASVGSEVPSEVNVWNVAAGTQKYARWNLQRLRNPYLPPYPPIYD